MWGRLDTKLQQRCSLRHRWWELKHADVPSAKTKIKKDGKLLTSVISGMSKDSVYSSLFIHFKLLDGENLNFRKHLNWVLPRIFTFNFSASKSKKRKMERVKLSRKIVWKMQMGQGYEQIHLSISCLLSVLLAALHAVWSWGQTWDTME